MWIAAALWVPVSAVAAVLLGRVIRRADQQELGPSRRPPTPDGSIPVPARSRPAP